jgi:hypothetical protein
MPDSESYSDWLQRMTPTVEDREYGRQMSNKETAWVPIGRHTWKLVGVVQRSAITNRYVTKPADV